MLQEFSQESPAYDNPAEEDNASETENSVSFVSGEIQVDSEEESYQNKSPCKLYTAVRNVNDKLDEILVSCDLEFDGRQCNTEEEEFDKQLELMRKNISSRAKVKDVTSPLEDLRNIGQERLH